jgi:hypothetical protein
MTIRLGLLATGFLLLAEPETNSKEQVSSDQLPETRSQQPVKGISCCESKY